MSVVALTNKARARARLHEEIKRAMATPAHKLVKRDNFDVALLKVDKILREDPVVPLRLRSLSRVAAVVGMLALLPALFGLGMKWQEGKPKTVSQSGRPALLIGHAPYAQRSQWSAVRWAETARVFDANDQLTAFYAHGHRQNGLERSLRYQRAVHSGLTLGYTSERRALSVDGGYAPYIVVNSGGALRGAFLDTDAT